MERYYRQADKYGRVGAKERDHSPSWMLLAPPDEILVICRDRSRLVQADVDDDEEDDEAENLLPAADAAALLGLLSSAALY